MLAALGVLDSLASGNAAVQRAAREEGALQLLPPLLSAARPAEVRLHDASLIQMLRAGELACASFLELYFARILWMCGDGEAALIRAARVVGAL